jgi:hypothetical protein
MPEDENLSQPGGLEVEQMQESDELKNRRTQMHGQIQGSGALEQPAPSEGGGEELFDDEGGFTALLEEARLSPRHLRFCCGGILVLAILGGLIFGGIKLFGSLGNGDDSTKETKVKEEPVVEEMVEEDDETPDMNSEGDEDLLDLDFSLEGSLLVGDEDTEEDESPEVTELIGKDDEIDDEFTQRIADFAMLYEAMLVDVNAMLDQSADRDERLENYMDELTMLYRLGGNNRDQLLLENEDLVDAFEEVEESKDAYEEDFFNELKNLNATASSQSLDLFIEDAKEVTELRAEYRARQKLIEYYDLVLEAMELRMTVLELNEEALVKGVQVVDIEGSDIELIIRESEL